MISGIQHVNLTVGVKDEGSAPLLRADKFYGEILGLSNDPVPKGMEDSLRWFSFGSNGQQIHVSLEHTRAPLETKPLTRGHPCFVLPFERLTEVIDRLNAFAASGDAAACSEVIEDQAGIPDPANAANVVNGHRRGDRFFVRDFSGNRLEFSGI